MEQIDLFSYVKPKFKIPKDKPIRLIETFGGIGSQIAALKRIGANIDQGHAWKYIEIDTHAVESYNAINGTSFAPQDITKTHAQDLEIIDRDSYMYILVYSFPCQSLSLAGKRELMEKDSGTESSLLWEIERILLECKDLNCLPQLLLMENVPQVHGKGAIGDFQVWMRFLESLGYSNAFKDLNAKDYGYPHPIPQNRNRSFLVSMLGDYHYDFPRKQKLELRLKDLLEDNVDDKYFLSEAMIKYVTKEIDINELP